MNREKRLYQVNDGSFLLEASSGEGLMHTPGRCFHNRRFEILARKCKLPAETHGITHEVIFNDCIIRDVDNDNVVFIQERFLSPLTGYCPNCGEPITGGKR